MKKLPTILSFIFLIIPINRIAKFGANELGEPDPINAWAFALGVAGIIFIASYYNRIIDEVKGEETKKSERVRKTAFILMLLFMSIDGLINTAKVLIDQTSEEPFTKFVTVVYGLTPTFAMALLGILQGHIDRLPKTASSSWIAKIQKMIEKKVKQKPQEIKDLLSTIETIKKDHRKAIVATQKQIESNQKENEKQLKVLENEKKQVETELEELRNLLDDDMIIILNGSSNTEKIKAWNRKFPKISNKAISDLVGCSTSQVPGVLNK